MPRIRYRTPDTESRTQGVVAPSWVRFVTAHRVLGIGVFIATLTTMSQVMANTGGHWHTGETGQPCKPGDPGDNYIGVCNEAGNANNANVRFDTGEAWSVYGGYTSYGIAHGNKATISGGEVGGVRGGYSEEDVATLNHVVITGGTIEFSVYGAESNAGGVRLNSVEISGGTILGSVYGGKSSSGDAIENRVEIRGGHIEGNVIAGSSASGLSGGNYIVLSGASTFSPSTILYGAYSDRPGWNDELAVGNRLEVRSKGLSAGNVKHFETYLFYLPSDIKNSETVLTLGDGARTQLGASKVGVTMQKDLSILQPGDRINLIHNDAGVDASQVKYFEVIPPGVFRQYQFTLSSDSQNLFATLKHFGLQAQTKAPVESSIADMALLQHGGDLIAGMGMRRAREAADNGGIRSFAALSGSALRYDSGSHVDVRAASLMLGLAARTANRAGTLTAGAFLEGGRGHYDSQNDFEHHTVRGKGTARYLGGGVLLRQDWTTGLYAEASLRAGRIRSDRSNHNMTQAPKVRYHTAAPYYGAHLGLGHDWALGERTSLDVSLRHFWSRQGRDSATLAGERFTFQAVDSQRTRVGLRLNRQLNEQTEAYAGLAWEREHRGVARATVLGLSTPSPSLKGNTGIVELGLAVRPSAKTPLTLGAGVQGHVGKRRGISATLEASWAF